jgi:hypothetical protein
LVFIKPPPKSGRGRSGRFDFRVPDGLGQWVYPDWEDPGLKVEFYDCNHTLQVTATVEGDPALVQSDDYHPLSNPQGGKFVSVEGIDLAWFALGLVEAHVYAKVGGLEVQPYPSIVAAFMVVADAGQGPFYTTVERVRAEVPGAWPDLVTDEMVQLAIADQGRKIDAFLGTCYAIPFPDYGDSPSTPPVIEIICRKLAAYQCLEWMGRVNAAAEEGLKERALSLLMRLAPSEGKAPLVRLAGYRGPLAVYSGALSRPEEGEEDVLA